MAVVVWTFLSYGAEPGIVALVTVAGVGFTARNPFERPPRPALLLEIDSEEVGGAVVIGPEAVARR